MANFKYTITKGKGQTDNGTIRSSTREEAEKLLKDQGLTVLNLEQVIEKKDFQLFGKKKVKMIEKVVFFDHLAQMLKAGLSVTETLDALKDDTENKYFQKIIEDLKYGIETGETLSKGMGKYPEVFPHLFVKVIEVGEIGGSLEESAKQISTQVKKDYELRAKVKGALIYPEILFSIMIFAGAGLLVFVIPQLSLFFVQAGLQLPITTQILIGISNFLRNDILLIIIVLITGYITFKKVRRKDYFRKHYDKLMLHLPIIGPINHRLNMAIYARTLGSLLRSGVPIGKSLEIVSDSSPNYIYSKAIFAFKDKVEKGDALSVVMQHEPKLFTNLSIRMVAVGDKTGTTPDMLFNVADFYQNQVNETLGNISTIIEPVMLFIMGGATLFIALSVITPIYQLTSGISSK